MTQKYNLLPLEYGIGSQAEMPPQSHGLLQKEDYVWSGAGLMERNGVLLSEYQKNLGLRSGRSI